MALALQDTQPDGTSRKSSPQPALQAFLVPSKTPHLFQSILSSLSPQPSILCAHVLPSSPATVLALPPGSVLRSLPRALYMRAQVILHLHYLFPRTACPAVLKELLGGLQSASPWALGTL